eukprot:NODE_1482_length_960_cov_132.534577_g1027_i0.p1 GENE.NODE_1482_length_960_cov_132.534577_g1027_i0~~NODE_1482_length_960_cov_132.534577_g1027_i0.p1  ORF type:complete len:109 (-),score=31.06 NODE_1482_length_960_cov_132.534577_g1027_i0:632-931(-)
MRIKEADTQYLSWAMPPVASRQSVDGWVAPLGSAGAEQRNEKKKKQQKKTTYFSAERTTQLTAKKKKTTESQSAADRCGCEGREGKEEGERSRDIPSWI